MNAEIRIQSIGPPQRELLIAMYRGFDPLGTGLANFANEGLKEDLHRVHLGSGSGQEAAEIHPRLLQISQAFPPGLHRSQMKDHS